MSAAMDEIRLTAFALGELDGAERMAVAAYVDQSESARRYVQEVRATAGSLSEELCRQVRERLLTLSARQHAAIEKQIKRSLRQPFLERPRTYRPRSRRGDYFVLALSMAASVLIVALVMAVLVPYLFHRFDVAQISPGKPGTSSPDYLVKGRPTPPDQHVGDSGWIPPLPDPTFAQNYGSAAPDRNDHAVDRSGPAVGHATAQAGGNETTNEAPLVGPPGRSMNHLIVPVAPLRLIRGGHGRAAVAQAGGYANASDQGVTYHSSAPQGVGSSPAPAVVDPGIGPDPDLDGYEAFLDGEWVQASGHSSSTFPLDVSSAAYSNFRRFINHNRIPPAKAVRVEEYLNAFSWSAPPPAGDAALSAATELAPCPWNPEHRLARVVVKAREPGMARPPLNVVFLIDGSESMAANWKLPLLKKSFKQALAFLGPRDRLSIVGGGHYLPPTTGADHLTILNAIDRLEAGGLGRGPMSFAMAYECAAGSLVRGELTRVVAVTDGDWEHSVSDLAAAERLVAQHARGVGLSIIELGARRLGAQTLRDLASRAGGTWACADTAPDLRKALTEQLNGGLIEVAPDASAEVIFNPALVESYRLVGFEPHPPASGQQFISAEIPASLGAGREATALYEIVVSANRPAGAGPDQTLMTLKVRYRDIAGQTARVLAYPISERPTPLSKASNDFRFAVAIAEMGMVLRDSPFRGNSSFAAALELAQEGHGPDEHGERQEFIELLRKAKSIAQRAPWR